MGLIASRKVGNAVRRNRLRRVFRENFRQTPTDGLLGNDFLVIFLTESKTLDPTAMGNEFAEKLAAAKCHRR
jgi:ribonuclease P protein component